MPQGRKKKITDPDTVSRVSHSAKSEVIESLYQQFDAILKKTKTPKREIANRVSMSYQGFLNSYNKKNLTLEKWALISRFLNLPLTMQFEIGNRSKAEASQDQEKTEGQKPAEISNTEERLACIKKYVATLEARLKDKEEIISLLQKGH